MLPRKHPITGEPIEGAYEPTMPTEVCLVPLKEDPAYLAFVATRTCFAMGCGTGCGGDVVAHHYPHKGMGGAKGDDRQTAPACFVHHGEWHQQAFCGDWSMNLTVEAMRTAQVQALCAYLDAVARSLGVIE